MGNFDDIILAGPADAVRCAHGHEVRELQTKDLGQLMDTYYVWEGRLYVAEPRGRTTWAQPTVIRRYRLDGHSLVVARETTASPATAGDVTAYTSCSECLPVLVESSGFLGGSISEQFPWVQVILTFEGNRLVDWRPDRVETRDDVRRKHPEAIPDDDRVAKRYFERRLRGDVE